MASLLTMHAASIRSRQTSTLNDKANLVLAAGFDDAILLVVIVVRPFVAAGGAHPSFLSILSFHTLSLWPVVFSTRLGI